MLEKISTFIDRIFKNFTFRQRFMLFASVFILCLPFPIYWLILGQDLYIESARSQIENFKHQKIWNSLLFDILKYHLYFQENNEEKIKYYKKRVLFNLGSLENRQTLLDKQLYRADFLKKLWQRMNSKEPSSSYVHFEQEDRLVEIILDELKLRTLGENKIHIDLLPNNQMINFVLCELYHIQIFSIKLLTWESLIKQEPQGEKYEYLFYMSMLRLKQAISEINNYINNNIEFNSLIKDPNFIQFIKEKNALSIYLKNLNDWINSIKKSKIQTSQRLIHEHLTSYNHIADSFINFGILYNERHAYWHELFKYITIGFVIFALSTVLFYICFYVLTNHFKELNNYIKGVSLGKFKPCFCSKAKDGFGPVGQAFDKLAQSIHQVVNELQRLGRQLAESIKQIAQSTSDQNNAFLSDERKILELEDYTNIIANRTEALAKTMSDLSLSSQQNTLSQTAKQTLKKMTEMIFSLTQRSNHIINHLDALKNKLDSNKNLFIFLTKVSNQADLLSLNSAIVASNIVNQKQGLIKISYEIKRFAIKTSSSTENMEKIINEIFLSIEKIFQNIHDFLNELNKSSSMLKVVEKHLTTMTDRMEDQSAKFLSINKTMQDQASLTHEIKKSLDSLSQIAKDNSKHTYHLGQTMIELGHTSEKLQFVLNQFFHSGKFKSKKNEKKE